VGSEEGLRGTLSLISGVNPGENKLSIEFVGSILAWALGKVLTGLGLARVTQWVHNVYVRAGRRD
jgi:hypothetical protein